MKPNQVPIPDRMKHLPLDRRGYPILYGVYVDKSGKPHFTINDERARVMMRERDLCSVCGHKLFRGRWFAGGPGSAFHPEGCYIDMPMHDECVHYALMVCPYLALPNYAREIGENAAKKLTDEIIAIDETMIPDRPAVFVAVMAIGQTYVGERMVSGQYVRPNRPYRKIEYWQHGRQLPDDVGKALADANLAALPSMA